MSLLFVFLQPAFSAEVVPSKAKKVAQNFIDYQSKNRTIANIEPMRQFKEKVGCVMQLNPRGYIIVAADTIRTPIKAYSFTSDFENLPPNYVNALKQDLYVPEQAPSTEQILSLPSAEFSSPENTNQPYWQFLTLDTVSSHRELASVSPRQTSYTPGDYLLDTQWNQTYPYNKLNPRDGSEPTLTGCTQTAMAQIMRYHEHPETGSGVFLYDWNGQTLRAVMNRPFNWQEMPDQIDGSGAEYKQNEIAALMRDLGIMNEANFGTDSTSAVFRRNKFERAFGYAPVQSMESDNASFIETIVNEIEQERPVCLFLPGHVTVADGYMSDGTGKKVHINLGWGGSHDDFYYLDETIHAGDYEFSPNHTIYYDIRPCEGEECNPYPPEDNANPPEIVSDLENMVLSSNKTLRIDARDPDGKEVTLSASSSGQYLQTSLNNNLLTLTPQKNEMLEKIELRAESADGTTQESFKVLVQDNIEHIGKEYNIDGKFADTGEVDEYQTYLQGEISISGDRGYSNHALYIWVEDQHGNRVFSPQDQAISGSVPAGTYTIFASLQNPSSGRYYYLRDKEDYILRVSNKDLQIADVAAEMDIYYLDAEIGSVPESPTHKTNATLTVNGSNLVEYKYKLDEKNWSNATQLDADIKLSNLSEGNHTLAVIGKDEAGNWQAKSNAFKVEWQVDTSAPSEVEIHGIPEGYISSNSTSISVSGEEVAKYKYAIDGGDYIGPIAANKTTSVDLSDLSEGEHSVSVKVCDQAGNWQKTENAFSSTWIKDSIPPEITGLSNSTAPVQEKNWSWVANENATFRHAVNQNSTYAFDDSAEFDSSTNASVQDENGTWYLHVQAKDEAGNVSDVTRVSALLDNIPPVAEIHNVPFSPSSKQNASLAVNGTEVSEYKYKLNNQTWSNATDVNSSIELTGLSEGNQTVTVIGKDKAGNWQSESNATQASWVVDTIMLGDINRDDALTLEDLILALQVVNNLARDVEIARGADVNKDEKIGMAEVMYIIHTLEKSKD